MADPAADEQQREGPTTDLRLYVRASHLPKSRTGQQPDTVRANAAPTRVRTESSGRAWGHARDATAVTMAARQDSPRLASRLSVHATLVYGGVVYGADRCSALRAHPDGAIG